MTWGVLACLSSGEAWKLVSHASVKGLLLSSGTFVHGRFSEDRGLDSPPASPDGNPGEDIERAVASEWTRVEDTYGLERPLHRESLVYIHRQTTQRMAISQESWESISVNREEFPDLILDIAICGCLMQEHHAFFQAHHDILSSRDDRCCLLLRCQTEMAKLGCRIMLWDISVIPNGTGQEIPYASPGSSTGRWAASDVLHFFTSRLTFQILAVSLFVAVGVWGLGVVVALSCFCFLFCKCFGIPNSPRILDLDDRQGLIASSAMQ